MLKRISTKNLILGMYLHEFCGSWMEHPFWRTAFVITDPRDIERILESSIKEVWIDSAKGLDVAPGETCAQRPASAFSAAALSIASQVNSGSSRPKWP